MHADHSRADELFRAASQLPAADRAAFLDAECGAADALRHLVEQRLQASDGSAVPPAVTGEFTPDPDEAHLGETADYQPSGIEGKVVAGRYTLVEPIGDGGMGEVWVAKQSAPVKRRVALKLIKAGMDTRAVMQRFEAERQALALMDHPNIARVLDGGMTDERRPFFAMELVNGLALTTFCDKAKLDIRQRLELFVPICQAVQHAHQKGIIHRDLKPSNILVTIIDGKPVPKVIDFGVAKAVGGKITDETMATQFGAVVGTLEYMAPEQAGFSGVDVDTRADIYSLGVILYELLTGLRPLDAQRLRKAALTEVIRTIQEEEPPKPSTRISTDKSLPSLAAMRQTDPRKLAAMLRGELDWIVMKCLEKQREERYESANGLARDIQRYLADEPIEARPQSANYRLRKFVHRNRGKVAAIAAVAVALLLGLVGSVWQATIANRQRAIALENEKKAVAQAKRAETISKFVTTVLRSSNPGSGGSQEMTVFAAMNNAIKDIDSGRFTDDPETEATLKTTIAMILQNNSRDAQTGRLYQEALDTLRRVHPGDHPDVAKLMGLVAYHRLCASQFKEAESLSRQSLAMYQRLYQADHDDVAEAFHLLACTLGPINLAESLPLMIQSLQMYQRLHPGDDGNVANLLRDIGDVQVALGRLTDADQSMTQALSMNRRLNDGDCPAVAANLMLLGRVKLKMNRLDEADALLTEALGMFCKFFQRPHYDIARSLNLLAQTKMALGRPADAEEHAADALTQLKSDHQNVHGAIEVLARARQALGKFAEARPSFDECITVTRRFEPHGSANLADLLWRSGTVRMELNDAPAARPQLEEAVAMAEKFLPPENPKIKIYRESLDKCKAMGESKR